MFDVASRRKVVTSLRGGRGGRPQFILVVLQVSSKLTVDTSEDDNRVFETYVRVLKRKLNNNFYNYYN